MNSLPERFYSHITEIHRDTMEGEVTAESKNHTKVEVNMRGYGFEIDEPEEHGGTGSAPNPVVSHDTPVELSVPS